MYFRHNEYINSWFCNLEICDVHTCLDQFPRGTEVAEPAIYNYYNSCNNTQFCLMASGNKLTFFLFSQSFVITAYILTLQYFFSCLNNNSQVTIHTFKYFIFAKYT